jgi:V/A-type H+-transporting ATPase subunit A
VGTFWALDASLANRRHFPAINWGRSYSLYSEQVESWYRNQVAENFVELRRRTMSLLQEEAALQEIVQLVGPDALQDNERLVIEAGRMIREDFLQQNAFSKVDGFCPPNKQYGILEVIMDFYDLASQTLRSGKMTIEEIMNLPELEEIHRLKEVEISKFPSHLETILGKISRALV